MTRRSLLRLLAMGVVGMELDVDRLLWVPGAKTFFLPPARPHTFTHVDWITREALRLFEHNLALIKMVNRTYDERFHV